MERKRWYGAIAAACVAGVGLDAWADASGYPVFHEWFGGFYDDVARSLYVLFILGAAIFGYLATRNGT